MATIEEKRAIVKRGVEEFAKAELGIEQALKAVTALEDVFRDAVSAGMTSGGSSIKIINRLRMAVGKLGAVSKEIHALHNQGTVIAKANDADIELPGDFVALGGGGR